MRQGKASGGSSSTNSPEGMIRGKWKTPEEENGKCNTLHEQKGEWNTPKGELNLLKEDWNSPKVEKGEWNTPKEHWNSQKGKWYSAEEHRHGWNIAEEHKQKWNSPEEHKQEWDSLVQHMDRKTISLKVSVPPRPEDEKRKKLRRDVKR